MGRPPYTHDLFVSYSRQGDLQLARELHRDLRRFARYRWQSDRLAIYRDESKSTVGQLWPSLSENLNESRLLLLIGSPASADSPWVEREVEHWLQKRRADSIVVVLASGQIVVDPSTRRYVEAETTALPAALCRHLNDSGEDPELIYLDKIRVGRARRFDREHRRDLAAIVGKVEDEDPEVLLGVAERRRNAFFATVAALLVAALAVMTGLFVTAERQRDRADDEADENAALFLAAEATSTLRTNPALAMALAIESLTSTADPRPEAIDALVSARLAFEERVVQPTGEGLDVDTLRLSRFAATDDGTMLVVYSSAEGRVLAVDTRDRSVVWSTDLDGLRLDEVAHPGTVAIDPTTDTVVVPYGRSVGVLALADGRLTSVSTPPADDFVSAVAVDDGTLLVGTGAGRLLAIERGAGGDEAREIGQLGSEINDIQVHRPTGDLAVAGLEGGVTIWDRTGNLVSRRTQHNGAVTALAFDPDGDVLASAGTDSTIRLWETESWAELGPPLVGLTAGGFSSVEFDDSGDRIVAASASGPVYLWDEGTEIAVIAGHRSIAWDAAFLADSDEIVSTGEDGSILFWETVDGAGPASDALGMVSLDVTTIAFDESGQLLATGASNGTVRLWEPGTSRAIGQPVVAHEGAVTALALDDDGTTVASAGIDGAIRFLDTGSWQEVGPEIEVGTTVWDLVIGPDGRWFATGDDLGTVSIWSDGPGGQTETVLGSHDALVADLALSEDGGRLVSASLDATARVWRTDTGELEHTIETPLLGPTSAAAIQPGGDLVALAGLDGRVGIWDLASDTPSEVGSWAVDGGRILSLTFDPTGQGLIVGSGDGSIWLFAVPRGELLGSHRQGHDGTVWKVAVSPDGRYLVSVAGDATAIVWDPTSLERIGQILDHEEGVFAVDHQPDGDLIATGLASGAVQLWSATTGEPVGEVLPGDFDGDVVTVSFDPSGALVAAGDSNGALIVWEVDSRSSVVGPDEVHDTVVLDLAFDPNGGLVATASLDGTVAVTDVAGGTTVAVLGEPGTGGMQTVAFSPDGTRLATAGFDGLVRFWDTSDWEPLGPELEHPDPVAAVAYGPDGDVLITGSFDHGVRFWDPGTGELLAEPGFGHSFWVNDVIVSPDGSIAVSASSDFTLRLWDRASGVPVGPPLTGFGDEVQSVSLSPDGRWLIGASENGDVLRWPAIWDRAEACSLAARYVTEAQLRRAVDLDLGELGCDLP